ncbi:hypothetical protein MAFF301069_25700 [Ralstonia pseudosolanacearum]|nr:hypothetical protein MAFF301560_26020 [Ralstonia solanacearum]BEU46033.1 hypothetical protein MAFF211519_13580 [Ralstonia pseudosolanacearum]BEU68015.1 hypothetical protein MAFF301069_25700 [Ralstonia pseudosolanacearum]
MCGHSSPKPKAFRTLTHGEGWSADLGPSKFGVHPDDAKRGFTGRRVDLLGRSIDVAQGEGPVEAVRRYLRECKTDSAWHLQKKVVVLLEPRELAGTIVWPV